MRLGGILSPVLLIAVYMDVLMMWTVRASFSLWLTEYYGCLMYADDIIIVSAHTEYAMRRVLKIYDQYATDCDVK